MLMQNNKKKDNLILSLSCNILIPVIILKNGDVWINQILIQFDRDVWVYKLLILVDISSAVFFIALICPVTYFFYDFLNRKKINLISILGFINILLTGGIGIFGSKLGLSKNWFIFKEGMMPIIIASVLIIMKKYRQSEFNNILLNETLFDNDKIRISISQDMQHQFEYLIREKKRKVYSSLVVNGEDSKNTAMAKTVGLPVFFACKLLLEDCGSFSNFTFDLSFNSPFAFASNTSSKSCCTFS